MAATTTHMNDTDRVQTWTYRIEHRACEVGGPVDLLITETLDFDARTLTSVARGTQDHQQVKVFDNLPIHPNVTPEAAAEYRRTHGYTRVQ